MRARFIVLSILVSVLILAAGASAVAQDKTVPKSVVKFTKETLTAIGRDAQLVAFVTKSNTAPVDVAKLKALDKKWQADDNMEDFVKALLGSPVSARLKKVISTYKYIPEAFIMNAQGTIIGETNKTSTYWKGEQEKFTAAYNSSAGAVWYGKLAFDESTGTNSVQVSVPVVSGEKAIGAITFTINIDEWEKR